MRAQNIFMRHRVRHRRMRSCSENNLFESIAEAEWEISGPFIARRAEGAMAHEELLRS